MFQTTSGVDVLPDIEPKVPTSAAPVDVKSMTSVPTMMTQAFTVTSSSSAKVEQVRVEEFVTVSLFTKSCQRHVEECRDFKKGQCHRGNKCRWIHTPQKVRRLQCFRRLTHRRFSLRSLNPSQRNPSLLLQMRDRRLRLSLRGFSPSMWSKQPLQRELLQPARVPSGSAKFVYILSLIRDVLTSLLQKNDEVCLNFQLGRCQWGDRCHRRHVHKVRLHNIQSWLELINHYRRRSLSETTARRQTFRLVLQIKQPNHR